jgi:hypothetical protein
MAEDAKRELERVQENLQADHEATDDAGVAYAAGLDESSTERTETLVRKLKEDLAHVERLLEESEAKCKALEDDIRVEKRRSMAAAMKAGMAMGAPVADDIGGVVDQSGQSDASEPVEEPEPVVEPEPVEEPPKSAEDREDADPVKALVNNIFSKFES